MDGVPVHSSATAAATRTQNQSRSTDRRTAAAIQRDVYSRKVVHPSLCEEGANREEHDAMGMRDVTHADQAPTWLRSDCPHGGFAERETPKVHDGDRKAAGLPLKDSNESRIDSKDMGVLQMRDLSGPTAFNFERNSVCTNCHREWRECKACKEQSWLKMEDRAEDNKTNCCKKHLPKKSGCLLKGFDIAVVHEVYTAAKAEAAYHGEEAKDQEQRGVAAVKTLAKKLTAKDPDAESYRTTCKSTDCMIQLGVMSTEDRAKFNSGTHRDANCEFGNKQYGNKKLFEECLTLIRELWMANEIDNSEVRALLEDTRKWTVLIEYREREFVGTAHAIANGAKRTGYPLTLATQQEFADNMQRFPVRFFDRVLVEHCLDDTYPPLPYGVNEPRDAMGPNNEKRSWKKELKALLKFKFPDALTCAQLYCVHANWQKNGEPTKEPKHFVMHDDPGKALYMGAKSFYKAVEPDLIEADTARKHVTTCTKVMDCVSSLTIGGTHGARSKANSTHALAHHLKSSIAQSMSDSDSQDKARALLWRVHFHGPACNLDTLKNNVEVEPRYRLAAQCWGEHGIPQHILGVFLARKDETSAKGWKVLQAKVVTRTEEVARNRTGRLRDDIIKNRGALISLPLGSERDDLVPRTIIRGMPSLLGMPVNVGDGKSPESQKIGIFKAHQQIGSTVRLHVAAKRIVQLLCKMPNGLFVPAKGAVQERSSRYRREVELAESVANPPTVLVSTMHTNGVSATLALTETDPSMATAKRALFAAHSEWNRLLCDGAVTRAMEAPDPRGWTEAVIDQLTDERCDALMHAANAMVCASTWRHEAFTGSSGICREYSLELVRMLYDFSHAVQSRTAAVPHALARSVVRTTPRYVDMEVDNTDAQKIVGANYKRLVEEGVLDPLKFSLRDYAVVDRSHTSQIKEVCRNRAKKRWFEGFRFCAGECACKQFPVWTVDVPDDPCAAFSPNLSAGAPPRTHFATLAEWKVACRAAEQASLPLPPRPKHFQAYMEKRYLNTDLLWPSHDDLRAKFLLEHLSAHTKIIDGLRLVAEDFHVNKQDVRALNWKQFNEASKTFDTVTLPVACSWLLLQNHALDVKFDKWKSLPPKRVDDFEDGVIDAHAKAEVSVITALWAPWPGRETSELPLTVNGATNKTLAGEVLALRESHYEHQARLRDESETWMVSAPLLQIFKHFRAKVGDWTNFRLSKEFQLGITNVLNARLCDTKEPEGQRKNKKQKKEHVSFADLLAQ